VLVLNSVLQWLSSVGFGLLGVVTLAQWLRHRPDPQRGYLALAIGLLGGLSLIGRFAALWTIQGVVYQLISLGMFMFCGYALFLFRGTMAPLSNRARRVVLGLVVAAILVVTVTPLPAAGSATRATPLQTAVTLLLVGVWCGCVGEPVIRLWRTSRRLSAVQRGRLRALVAGYASIIVILLVAVLGGSTAQGGWLETATSLAVIVVMMPLLAVSFLPPRWLRRAWRAREEEALVASMRDLIAFSADRETLAQRSLDWALRLLGAETGVIMDPRGRPLALRPPDDDALIALAASLNVGDSGSATSHGLACPLALQDGRGVLLVRPGPFTPSYGADELRRLDEFALSLTLALDHALLIERTNQSEQEARAANETKSAFLASMSHELRTPLGAIIGFAEVLADGLDGPLNDDQLEDAQQIKRSGRHLLSLLDEVLDLSKIEAGQMTLNREPVNMASLVPVVLDALQPLAKTKGLTLRCEGFDGVALHCDAVRIRQILTNLVGNALKFTETGAVVVSANRSNGHVRVAVADTGIGIREDALAYVFDEFRQVNDGRTKKYGGTGLGLAISRKLVEMHGGQIGAESTFGEGSTFWFTLPADADITEPTVADAPPGWTQGDGVWTGRSDGTVLVIDDEAAARVLICKRLEEAGYTTVPASSGAEALRLVTEISPAVITLDVKMPEMDGWTVLRHLRTEPHSRDIPVILVTMVDDIPVALEANTVAVVHKPFTGDDLARAIEGVLPPLENIDVLVVDDDPSVSGLIGRSLTSAKVTVRGVLSAVEALTAVGVKLPDLLFVDLLMPGMSGFELIARLRARPDTHDVPIIVVTAKSLTAEDLAVLRGQVDRLLSKDELGGDLSATVRQTLGRRVRVTAP
jgi:signal transduction histidine kinase/DNA-binding response OmpR family regulator